MNQSKFDLQKQQFENDQIAINDIVKEADEKLLDIDNKFHRLFIKMGTSINIKFKTKISKLTNNYYLRKVEARKRITVSMAGETLGKRIVNKTINGFFIFIMAIIILFPLYWMVITSFKTFADVNPTLNETLWPKHWSLEAYTTMFTYMTESGKASIPVSRFLTNSFSVAGLSAITQMTVSLIGGFALYNWKTKLNPFFMVIMFSLMMIPGESLLLGKYIFAIDLGWENSMLALIVPFIGNAFTIYLISNAFSSLSPDLKRAAKVDGLSTFSFFIRIAIPGIASTIATSMIIAFIQSWNSVLWPITIMDQDSTMATIPMMLYGMINITGEAIKDFVEVPFAYDPINMKMAASVISILPIFIVFVVFNKWIIKGLTSRNGGGGKG
ncbi:carbohydrate ABC transporter permease [[Acholeplasma] multilocale]|uniref:carbohydrate ABC transporter permease n=1 Tax=[Acholeplasma] multilocale TaxID=264638 RepID=UPI00047BCAC9|nr:carbohydrate ABC transporter permease [[Acholeplasma] multilocale]